MSFPPAATAARPLELTCLPPIAMTCPFDPSESMMTRLPLSVVVTMYAPSRDSPAHCAAPVDEGFGPAGIASRGALAMAVTRAHSSPLLLLGNSASTCPPSCEPASKPCGPPSVAPPSELPPESPPGGTTTCPSGPTAPSMMSVPESGSLVMSGVEAFELLQPARKARRAKGTVRCIGSRGMEPLRQRLPTASSRRYASSVVVVSGASSVTPSHVA